MKNGLKYGISFGISLILVAIYLFTRIAPAELGAAAPMVLYLTLCDAFTIPGIVFFMSGCLVSLSNEGALDGVGFVVSHAIKMLIPGMSKDQERYADYIERRREKRLTGYGFLYITGLVCLAFAGIFMLLFYSVY